MFLDVARGIAIVPDSATNPYKYLSTLEADVLEALMRHPHSILPKDMFINIVEKPKKPKSNYVGVGLYVFDNRVCRYAKQLKPSKRGELEITDLIKIYLKKNELKASILDGLWEDAGTFDSLLRINNIMAKAASVKTK